MLTLLALLTAPSHAWDTVGYVWPDEALPVPLVVTGSEDSMSEADQLAALQDAIDGWHEDWCWDELVVLSGTEETGGVDTSDGVNRVAFDDPDDLMPDGVWVTTYTRSGSETVDVGSAEDAFRAATDSDIVFNDGVTFHTDAEIEDGECVDGVSMRRMFGRAVGFLLGVASPCSNPDDCDDLEAEALMAPSDDAECNIDPVGPNDDDLAGLEFLYATVPRVVCGGEGDELHGGEVRLTEGDTLVCEHLPLRRADRVTAASWDPGDGSPIVDGMALSHEVEAGVYTVTACLQVDSPGCGSVEMCDPGRTVRVCPVLDPAFEVEVEPGSTTVELVNLTDDSVSDCISDWSWQVSDAAGAVVYEGGSSWSPMLTLDGPGVYDVELTVDGVTASGSFELLDTDAEVDDDAADEGCGCSSSGGAPWLGLLALAAVARRRAGR